MTKPSEPRHLPCLGVALLSLVLAACGGGRGDAPTPEPTLAGSREAAQAYRRVEARWRATVPARRVTLLPELSKFIDRFGEDPTARRVRLYRTWLFLESGQLARARTELKAASKIRSGADADLRAVLEGAMLTRRGRAAAALRRLEPLRGKLIDPDDRYLFAMELVRAALDAKRYGAAMTFMLDFAERAPAAQLEDVKATIRDQLRLVPSAALEEAFDTLRDSGGHGDEARSAARKWLRDTVRAQLIRHALGRQDVELARRLLDRIPSTLRLDETREALRRLAARAAVDPRVEGRALGLVLEVFDDRARRRSADVAAGVAKALGLSARGRPLVRLISREARAVEDVGRALAALAGDGAAILVAGTVPESARRARGFADKAEIPVILLTDPGTPPDTDGFAFVLGEARGRDREAIDKAMDERGAVRRVLVGPGGGVPCDSTVVQAGVPRFPVRDWERAGVDTLVLLGDELCAADVVAEARDSGFAPAVVLGFDAGRVDLEGLGAVSVLSAGQFRTEGGPTTSWYGALGHDVARLGAASLADFPLKQTLDSSSVRALHRRARDVLASVSVDLWTTDASGFGGARQMSRELRVVEMGASK